MFSWLTGRSKSPSEQLCEEYDALARQQRREWLDWAKERDLLRVTTCSTVDVGYWLSGKDVRPPWEARPGEWIVGPPVTWIVKR